MFLKKVVRILKNNKQLWTYSKNDNSVVLMFHSILKFGESRKSYFLDFNDFKKIIIRFKKQIADINYLLSNPSDHKIAITFDDIRNDVLNNAVPLLIANRIPFTIFINTSLLDKEGYISSKQLLRISKYSFVTIGSHCVNHKPLKHLPFDVQQSELKESKLFLENFTKRKVVLLAYPYGQYDKSTLRIAKKLYDASFISYGGLLNNNSIKNRHTIPRHGVDDSTIDNTINLIERYINKKRN